MIKGKFSTSWREKLEKQIEPKIVEVPDKWAARIGHGKMLVPTPLLVDAAIRKIPRGKLVTVNILRDYLAHVHKADITCPLTTGIFLNIAAQTAEEDKEKGKIRITPYWRVLKEGGSLNPKFPGGVHKQAGYLKKEGYDITREKKGNGYMVNDFEKKLTDMG